MKIGEFEFSLREFAGSLGDFGTLIPFVVGYILVNDFDPASLLIMFAQIPLTLTNAVVGTNALIKEYFPKKKVTPRSLILNMGFMNTLTSFFRGMPLCHGSGGLASQYFYGARTGGALIMEGTLEIFLGLFLANSVGSIFKAFPFSVLGAMLLFAGLELGRIAFKIKDKKEIFIILTVGVISAITNLAVGFFIGLILFFLLKKCINSKPRH